MTNDDGNEDAPQTLDRGRLVRDVAVLQLKLVVDGFRDLLLVPASLVAGVISLFRGSGEFYDLLRLGRRSEHWINLFGALDRGGRPAGEQSPDEIERLVERVEAFVVDEYRHGHLSGQAREQVERAVRRIRETAERHGAGARDAEKQ